MIKEIPLCIPSIGAGEIQEVKKVLASHWLAHGPKNEEFERIFAQYLDVSRAVTLNSCTSALFLAVVAQGITREVILPSFTFVASANAVVTAGAKPVFADINPDNFCISDKEIEKKISKNTEAILVVHYAGQSCLMDKIMSIAAKNNLKIIEDSAQAIGATYKEKKTGSWATGCFSFFPTKNITTGEGGMVATNDEALADKIKALSSHGITSTTLSRKGSKKPWEREALYAGYNFRMSNILAAIGVEQMKKVDRMNQKRRDYAFYLNKALSKVEEIIVPQESPLCYHTYQMYVIRLRNSSIRDALLFKLKSYGVGVSVHYDPPVHLHPYYREKFGYKEGDLPITEQVSKSIITLPMFPQLKKYQLDTIIKLIKKSILETKRS